MKEVLIARRPCGCAAAAIVYDKWTTDSDLGAFYRSVIDRGYAVERAKSASMGPQCEACAAKAEGES